MKPIRAMLNTGLLAILAVAIIGTSCAKDSFYEMTAIPQLVSPAPNAPLTTTRVSLVWGMTTYAEAYEVIVDGQYMGETGAAQLNFSLDLQPRPEEYCWMIRARNNFQYMNSATRCFTINLEAPVLLSPGDQSTICHNDQTFAWEGVDNVDGYRLEIFRGANWTVDSERVYVRDVGTTTHTVSPELPEGTYTWYVTSLQNGKPGPTSVKWVVTLARPYAPGIFTPVDGSIFCSPAENVEFGWGTVDNGTTGTVTYEWEITRTNDQSIFETGSSNGTSFVTTIPNVGDYVTRVRATIEGCVGDWSDNVIIHVTQGAVAPTDLLSVNACDGVDPILEFSGEANYQTLDLVVMGPLGSVYSYSGVSSPVTIPAAHLTDGRGTYRWYVAARGEAPCGANLSAIATFNMFPQPYAPTPLKAKNVCEGEDVIMNWTGGYDYSTLDIEVWGGACAPCVNTGVSMPHAFSGLLRGEYTFRVRANGPAPCVPVTSEDSPTFTVYEPGSGGGTDMYWYRRGSYLACFSGGITACISPGMDPHSSLYTYGYTITGDTTGCGTGSTVPTGNIVVLSDGAIEFTWYNFEGQVIVTRDSAFSCMFYQSFGSLLYGSHWSYTGGSSMIWDEPTSFGPHSTYGGDSVIFTNVIPASGYTSGGWTVRWMPTEMTAHHNTSADHCGFGNFQIERLSDGRLWCWVHTGPTASYGVPGYITYEKYSEIVDYGIRASECFSPCV